MSKTCDITAAVAKKFWLTPPALLRQLNDEFNFDFDPCPYPLPAGYNSLVVPWGKMNYVNPPFRIADGPYGGPVEFARKAIEERDNGNKSVIVLPVPLYVDVLVRAGVEIRAAGRIRWEEVGSRQQYTHGRPCCLFILK
jgi:hypothetical protein